MLDEARNRAERDAGSLVRLLPCQWPLQRYIGRREYDDETHLVIAGLVSARTARR